MYILIVITIKALYVDSLIVVKYDFKAVAKSVMTKDAWGYYESGIFNIDYRKWK